jgi:hypothetical protein
MWRPPVASDGVNLRTVQGVRTAPYTLICSILSTAVPSWHNIQLLAGILREVLRATKRLTYAANRRFVVILDCGIDDKCRPDKLSFPGIEEPNREHDIYAGFLCLPVPVITVAPPFVSLGSSYLTSFR